MLMEKSSKSSRQNRKSYLLTMLFLLPAVSLSNIAARSDEMIAGIAKIAALILVVYLAIWSARRLRNAGKSAWWTLALIPPATIFLLLYNFFAPSSRENTDTSLYMYGIRAKGFWRIAGIAAISLFLAYLVVLFATFLTDGL